MHDGCSTMQPSSMAHAHISTRARLAASQIRARAFHRRAAEVEYTELWCKAVRSATAPLSSSTAAAHSLTPQAGVYA